MRKEELRTYIENHESEMIEDLKSLIRIPSEKQAAEPGKPFGAPAAEALAQGIEILEKYGFAVTNYDNYAIAADFNPVLSTSSWATASAGSISAKPTPPSTRRFTPS